MSNAFKEPLIQLNNGIINQNIPNQINQDVFKQNVFNQIVPNQLASSQIVANEIASNQITFNQDALKKTPNRKMSRTPNNKSNSKLINSKQCPLSNDKLRRKLNCESNQKRKQKRDNLFNKQRNSLHESTSLKVTINTINRSSKSQLELKRQLETFYLNLQSKYLAYKQSTNALDDLINYLCKENRSILTEWSKVQRVLWFENDLMMKFAYGDENVENKDSVEKLTENLVEITTKLINEIVNDFIACCFKIFNLSNLQKFNEFILYLHSESMTSMDQENQHILNLITYCNTDEKDEAKIIVYINMFIIIKKLIDGIDENDELYTYITSKQFLSQLQQHTAFVIYLHKRNEEIQNNQPAYKTLDFVLMENYIEFLFNFAHLSSTELTFDTLEDQNDLYRLISNLKELVKLANRKSLIYYVQIINNFFEPFLGPAVIDFLIPIVNVEELCSIIKINFANYTQLKKQNVNDDTTQLIETIIRLFTNLTSIESYSKVLINCGMIHYIQSILILMNELHTMKDELVCSLLILIKNIIFIKLNDEPKSYFETAKSGYDLIFSSKFVPEFIASIDHMNNRCKIQVAEILSNLFKLAESSLIKKFLSLKFLRALHNLLQFNDQNVIYSTLEVLLIFILNNKLVPGQLIYLLNYYQFTGLLDLIESLSNSKNDQISKLASKLLDRYYSLADLEEI